MRNSQGILEYFLVMGDVATSGETQENVLYWLSMRLTTNGNRGMSLLPKRVEFADKANCFFFLPY
ncbi:MAG: hypothetical protein JXM79_15860 [Sedimentisphaerales bacterium]|nr:hypothetical protein [Sedimentisphaerales bacterium]